MSNKYIELQISLAEALGWTHLNMVQTTNDFEPRLYGAAPDSRDIWKTPVPAWLTDKATSFDLMIEYRAFPEVCGLPEWEDNYRVMCSIQGYMTSVLIKEHPDMETAVMFSIASTVHRYLKESK